MLKLFFFCIPVSGERKSSEAEEGRRGGSGGGGSRTSSVSDEGGFNEPSPEVVARLRPADYREPAPLLTRDHRDHERARSDPDTLSAAQQVLFTSPIISCYCDDCKKFP